MYKSIVRLQSLSALLQKTPGFKSCDVFEGELRHYFLCLMLVALRAGRVYSASTGQEHVDRAF